jgi:hypothetical protein
MQKETERSWNFRLNLIVDDYQRCKDVIKARIREVPILSGFCKKERNMANRRDFLKSIGLGAAAMAVPGCATAGQQTAKTNLIQHISRKLEKQLLGEATDKFIEILLSGMELSFYVFKDADYQEHLKDSEGRYFEGRYLFQTADEAVAASATFHEGHMHVHNDTIDKWDIKITFQDDKALRDYLFSKDQDILNSIAENKVEVDGNLNYIYKFGFMAKDLLGRLKLGIG